ncbi:hypothetical protein KTN05_17760, partial [Paracoccus sp. Z118]|uniref:hypothetical protein n=1 Tax=Paracoccus sp. Z118 TaxID=2851017 RepID=UPI001C2BEC28
ATLALSFALALGTAPGLAAAQAHDHGNGAATIELTLNQGAKWQGDENMHKGMDAIRATMAANLDAIRDDTLAADAAKEIAAEVQAQVDFMVETCVLTPEVDEQFHLVLGQVLEGLSDLEAGDAAQEGAARIVQALNAYGEHFEHPGWEPLA